MGQEQGCPGVAAKRNKMLTMTCLVFMYISQTTHLKNVFERTISAAISTPLVKGKTFPELF